MERISSIQFSKKIAELVAEELKARDMDIHNLPTEASEALFEAIVFAGRMLTEEMDKWLS